jgi:hypothetical protein
MIDGLYLKSLFCTFIVYLLVVGMLAGFVLITGIAGVFTLFGFIVLLVCYFYGYFSRNIFRKKGFRS